MSNIAEGFDSGSSKSFINFFELLLSFSIGSSITFIVSIDLQYINIVQFNDLYNRAKEIKNLIGGLINKTHYELITHLD